MSETNEIEGELVVDPKSDPQYLQFECLAPGSALNRWSHLYTRRHDCPGAQAMLYGAGVPNERLMKQAAQVGIATIWWEGNPCNTHLFDLGRTVKRNIERQGMLGWQYSTIGVSDGITNGTEGMRFSLQSRDLIADCIETATYAQRHDANISIPGCDKNMPGVVMAAARHNRPFLMIYGGTILKGHSKLLERDINISACYEAQGAYAYGHLQAKTAPGTLGRTVDDVMSDLEHHACPGVGACPGMYTANTMATAIEAMGLTLPGSSSYPAESPEKARECERAAEVIKTTMEKDIRPRDLLTRRSFENAIVLTMILGGSTNSVLHLLAMANTAEVPLTIDDFQRIGERTPVLANLVPSGKYYMEDLYMVGGTPSVLKMLIAAGRIHGDIPTVTGRTLAENVADWPSLAPEQTLIRPLSDPIKPTGHIQILRGNLAPNGAVAKISGQEGVKFEGKALVFNKEKELYGALARGSIKPAADENLVLVVRYEGPRGGPGMPEQLKASAALNGAGLDRQVSIVTDGRYSGASHGFIVGHVTPEAARGGPIALVRDGDRIVIDAVQNRIDLSDVDDEEMRQRRAQWRVPPPFVKRGVLAKYARLVGDASHGAVTDQWEDEEMEESGVNGANGA